MIRVSDKYTVKIISNDNLGNGIAKIDDMVIFVLNALKDENIEIEITRVTKKYCQAKIIKILDPSNTRIRIDCPCYNECGGCAFLHTTYNNEREIKETYLKRIFNINNIKGSSSLENNYRNKGVFHIKNKKIGFYKEKSNDIVTFDNCLLLHREINKIYNLLKVINLSKISEIMVRISNNDEILISINGNIDKKDINFLVDNSSNIKSIYQNDKLIYGMEYIVNNINNLLYTVYPNSFFQVNYDGMINLYNIIKGYAGNGNKLLDLYCGTGTIGIYLHENFKNIIGIEIVKSSIKNAMINKEINYIDNIDFILGDASEIDGNDYDTVIVDPPRSGLDDRLINALETIGSSKIIYVSCNPNTLIRDIKKLAHYEIKELSAVHMFPRTKHIECVALLGLKEKKK